MRKVVLFILFVILFSACQKREVYFDLESVIENNNFNVNYTLDTLYLVENNEENVVSIDIPFFEDEEIDKLVNDYVVDYFNDYTGYDFDLKLNESDIESNGVDYTQYNIDIKYEIAFYSNEFVSIKFEGDLNNKNAMHPVRVFFTLNIDMVNKQEVEFGDIYKINDDIYEIYKNYVILYYESFASADFIEKIKNDFDLICSNDKFVEGLKNGDIHTYYTQDFVGISVEVGHSIGDHFEVEIPYSEFEKMR